MPYQSAKIIILITYAILASVNKPLADLEGC